MAALSQWPVEPLTDATVAAFLCILGANVGSFLNVVAHRAPRGTSVVHGGSRCPACGSPVRWHDNVPVLGWLLLRGRCRDCDAAIAPRYPLVEAAGMLVGAITAVELLSGGRTWPPGRFGTGRMGADVLLVQADWPLALVCAAHGALLLVLLTWTLFEADRTPVSWRRFLAAAAGLGTIAVAAGGPLHAGGWPAFEQAALGTAAAAVVGSPIGNRWLRQALLLVGLVLGWQALVTVAAVMPAVAAARIAIARGGGMWPGLGPSCGDLLGAVGVQVLAWRWLAAVWLRDV